MLPTMDYVIALFHMILLSVIRDVKNVQGQTPVMKGLFGYIF